MGPPAGMLPDPRALPRQRPVKDRPCRARDWRVQDLIVDGSGLRWCSRPGGGRHQGDSRYMQGRAPRWPCGSVSGRATTGGRRRRELVAPAVLDGGPPCPCPCSCPWSSLGGFFSFSGFAAPGSSSGSRRRPGPGHRPAAPRTPSTELSARSLPSRRSPTETLQSGLAPVRRRGPPAASAAGSAVGPGRRRRVPRPASPAPMPADRRRRGG